MAFSKHRDQLIDDVFAQDPTIEAMKKKGAVISIERRGN